jgi:hypothetical protein
MFSQHHSTVGGDASTRTCASRPESDVVVNELRTHNIRNLAHRIDGHVLTFDLSNFGAIESSAAFAMLMRSSRVRLVPNSWQKVSTATMTDRRDAPARTAARRNLARRKKPTGRRRKGTSQAWFEEEEG